MGRVVVTGADGFIGRRLVRMLTLAGAEVSAWGRAKVDLTNREAVSAALDVARPDTVFHLAASGLIANSPTEGIIAQNEAMSRNLAESMLAGTRLVYSGSCSEYGASGLLSEDQPCTPRTAYGEAKLVAGMSGAVSASRHGVEFVHARLFGVYGPGEPEYRLIPAVLRALSLGEPVALSDCAQRRDFVHVDDACAALIKLALSDFCELPVNVGTGVGVIVRDAVNWVADGLKAPHELLHFGTRQRSIHDEDVITADTRRLAHLLGDVPPQRLGPGFNLAILGPTGITGDDWCQ